MKSTSLQKHGSLVCGVFLLFCLHNSALWAFDREELLPPTRWRITAHLQVTPAYEKAFGNDRKTDSLRNLLIQNPEMRQRIAGTIQRQEIRVELGILYGFSENWMLAGTVPFLHKTQISDLALQAEARGVDVGLDKNAERVVENLKSTQVQGLGDVELQTFYVFNYTISHFFRSGLGVRLPSGQAGTPFGRHSLALGERHVGLLGMIHYTYYPAFAKMRHELRASLMHNLKGTRQSLEGQKGDYYAGNTFEMDYTLGYEQNNWLVEGELQHRTAPESTLAEIPQDDAFFVDTLHLNLGYGNLSTLENYPLAHPYHVRMGYKMPLRGRNTPIAPSWHLMGMFYF